MSSSDEVYDIDIKVLTHFFDKYNLSKDEVLRILVILLSSKSSVSSIKNDIFRFSQLHNQKVSSFEMIRLIGKEQEGPMYFSLLSELMIDNEAKEKSNIFKSIFEYINTFKIYFHEQKNILNLKDGMPTNFPKNNLLMMSSFISDDIISIENNPSEYTIKEDKVKTKDIRHVFPIAENYFFDPFAFQISHSLFDRPIKIKTI